MFRSRGTGTCRVGVPSKRFYHGGATNGKVMVLGGYGIFGGKVCNLLAREGNVNLIIAGMNM
jgi:hypothetical protein